LQLCGLPQSRLGSIRLLLFHTLVFLRQCGYDGEDILIILASASAYFRSCHTSSSSRSIDSEPQDLGNDIVLWIFLAHSYVMDRTCPLSHWQQRLFGETCSIRALNGRVVKLCAGRGYVLRVEEEFLKDHLRALRAVALRQKATSRSKAVLRPGAATGSESSNSSPATCCVPWRLLMRNQR
jgi:hypothetical protein